MPHHRRATSALLILTLGVSGAPAVARELPDFSRLVQQQSPAVVNISATQKIKHALTDSATAPLQTDEGFTGDPLRHPFGDPEAEDSEGPSLGSGLVISEDGFILTCAHVVEEAREIQVRLNDRREFSARLVGADRRSDVAMLKIEARGLRQRASAIRPASRSASGCWPSARRSASPVPPPPASSPQKAGTCRRRIMSRSSRPTSPSIPATPAARCSISRAR